MKKKDTMPSALRIKNFESRDSIFINPNAIVDDNEFSEDKPAYDWVPRPYTKHQPDIEKRRASKMIEMMNSAEEDYKFEEYDSRVRFSPSGVLIFHVMELFDLSVNSTTFIRSLPVSFYCVLSIGIIKRCSKVVHSLTAKRIRMDYAAHFSLDISEWRESPSNRFNLELWSFQDPESHFIVGSMEFHVYEFIRKTHAIETHELWSDGIRMGSICVEYCFAYGYLGYGHSNQFKNPRNPIMETVSHSMYPRIRLDDDDELDKVYRARLPGKLKVFSYDSLILEMDKQFLSAMSDPESGKSQDSKPGIGTENLEPKPMLLQQVRFEGGKPVHCKIHMNIHQKVLQADFNDSYGEYICIGGRKNRLEHLNSLAQGRMRDIRETEAGALFLPFKDREADKIIVTEQSHPGFILFPNKVPCPGGGKEKEINSKTVNSDDAENERVLDLFPAVRREQGFLSVLFGYEKKPKPSMFINDMDYPLYKEAMKKWKEPGGCCRRCRWMFLRIAAFFNWLYNFIFPEIRIPPNVPEISVTLASPEGSTTDLYTYFVRDQKEIVQTKTEKLQSQVTNFMESVDNPIYEDSDDADSLSSSEGDQELSMY